MIEASAVHLQAILKTTFVILALSSAGLTQTILASQAGDEMNQPSNPVNNSEKIEDSQGLPTGRGAGSRQTPGADKMGTGIGMGAADADVTPGSERTKPDQ
ncbi:hypothetical protein MOX02_53500 [Methylobacterium oxalidis]|uniref:Uncharacterized protein n=1 Tax=Methylobacterium oxalidis TaxID=944322 RepID=A0A512JBH2_9HYPH|nr:hypothetical protein MOX02_53500 [Methylobacterium oxalidis]GLS64104.1 hypothetical protein GCM10007888_24850 [Methylobacterium oxalidis]